MKRFLRLLLCVLLAAALTGAAGAADGTAQTARVPVLMYHHLREDPGASAMIVSRSFSLSTPNVKEVPPLRSRPKRSFSLTGNVT